jgi:hypothetical protein
MGDWHWVKYESFWNHGLGRSNHGGGVTKQDFSQFGCSASLAICQGPALSLLG